jgi:hypothetical protein
MSVTKDRYDRSVSRAHTAPTDEGSIRLSELSALVQMRLGEPLDPATSKNLARIQEDLWRRRADLVAALASEVLKPEEYLARLNEALCVAMDRSRALFGQECFRAIFGDVGLNPEADRETFMAQVSAP